MEVRELFLVQRVCMTIERRLEEKHIRFRGSSYVSGSLMLSAFEVSEQRLEISSMGGSCIFCPLPSQGPIDSPVPSSAFSHTFNDHFLFFSQDPYQTGLEPSLA